MNDSDQVLESAREAFSHWRANRKVKGPIPGELMQLAHRAAMAIDVSSVAKQLGLNRTQLARSVDKFRLESHDTNLTTAKSANVFHFSKVELSPQFQAIPTRECAENEACVKISLGNGSTISFLSLDSVRILCKEIIQNGVQ